MDKQETVRILSLKCKASMSYGELKDYKKFEDDLTRQIYRAGFKTSFELKAQIFAKSPSSDNFTVLEDAMMCWQHIMYNMELA
jgi:hypothetical protein